MHLDYLVLHEINPKQCLFMNSKSCHLLLDSVGYWIGGQHPRSLSWKERILVGLCLDGKDEESISCT